MKTQTVKLISPYQAEKQLNGLISEGFKIISMTTTDFGILVVLETDFISSEVKESERKYYL